MEQNKIAQLIQRYADVYLWMEKKSLEYDHRKA